MFIKNFSVKATAIFLVLVMLMSLTCFSAFAKNGIDGAEEVDDGIPTNESKENVPTKDSLNLNCKSAILIEAQTGRVLYEQNADEPLPPASVTKIMTLLLVAEAIEKGKIKLDDKVSASAHAASMGGSQIFLKEGEEMTVEDLIKSVVIASANDAACALAEYVSGSEETFVSAMNERARELNMKGANFENTNGLDDTSVNHVVSARDIALMSRELVKHEIVLKYSSKWMDTVRNGLFGLTNTNRLVRFYKGCTGLKTGSTHKAGFCVSASAEREGMNLICVIMGAESGNVRNAEAAKLLDWGFANYALYEYKAQRLGNLRVMGGRESGVEIESNGFSCVVEKNVKAKIECKTELTEYVSAPVKKGDKVGEILFVADGKTIGKTDIFANGDVDKIGYFGLWWRMLGKYLLR